MANTHGYINTTHCASWDVDAYTCSGVGSADIDNGVFVTLGTMNVDGAALNIEGYEFNVTAADDTATTAWVVDTPEVGSTLEMQLMSDPRYFYNIAGKPMTLRYLVPKVDCIEVDANCFVGGTMPTTTNNVVTIGAGGKLVAGTVTPTGGKVYFTLEGFHKVSVGMVDVPTAVLRIRAN